MSDDLVRLLRNMNEYEPLGHDGWKAADRIEELEAKLDKVLEALELMVEGYRDEANPYSVAGFYRNLDEDECMVTAIKILAETKGESHE